MILTYFRGDVSPSPSEQGRARTILCRLAHCFAASKLQVSVVTCPRASGRGRERETRRVGERRGVSVGGSRLGKGVFEKRVRKRREGMGFLGIFVFFSRFVRLCFCWVFWGRVWGFIEWGFGEGETGRVGGLDWGI